MRPRSFFGVIVLLLITIIMSACVENEDNPTEIKSVLTSPIAIADISGDNIIITWDSIAGAEKYKIYRSETNEFNDQTPAIISVISSPFVDTDVEKGKHYFYWISTVTKSDESAPLILSGPTSIPNDVIIPGEQSNLSKPKGAAIALSEKEYDALPPLHQYQVANKLSATLYKGIPPAEFFDLDQGIDELKVTGGENYLTDTREALSLRLTNKAFYSDAIKSRHNFSQASRKAAATPLATIYEYPLSKDFFGTWMAYTLANTILFSPAEEIDSANHIDIQRVYNFLLQAMSEDTSIRDIIFSHQSSEANWRRFRSPEDNTREMIEIYLGLFNRDSDVVKASITCKNWQLTDDDDGYQLIIDHSEANTEPQLILDNYMVTSCEDFYKTIVDHPLLIPHVTTFLVNRFFVNFNAEKRLEIIEDILTTNPVQFHDIFVPILFSKEYLLNNEKAKSFEETFFNLAERLYWENQSRFLDELVNTDLGSSQPTLSRMGQPTMRLKLGRPHHQPLDSLSFATYHQAVRDRVLVINSNRWGSWGSKLSSYGSLFNQEEYVQYLFISTLARKASTLELETLINVIETGNEINSTNQAKIVLDYISRLPEVYFYNAVN